MRKKRPVFAIIRVDESHGPEATIETRVTVKEVVATQEVAEREVERLTRINGAKGCRYYCQSTRFVEILENPGIAKDGNGGSMG